MPEKRWRVRFYVRGVVIGDYAVEASTKEQAQLNAQALRYLENINRRQHVPFADQCKVTVWRGVFPDVP